MSLKDELDRAKREHREAVEKAARLSDSESESQRRKWRAAAEIVDAVPGSAREALARGDHSIELCPVETYAEVASLPGLGGAIRDLIAAEGLAHKLWIDFDLSGRPEPRNRLMLRLD